MSQFAHEGAVSIFPVRGLPEVYPGDDVSTLLANAILESVGDLQSGDVVVVTHKIVSKAEGRVIDLADVEPGVMARKWAESWGKDARQVEVVLQESKRIVRMHHGLIIAETEHGFICANAGVDASNTGLDQVVMLPHDPDASAMSIREALMARFDVQGKLGVIVSDSFGRPWRNGIVNIAIGAAGIAPISDYRGQHDPSGYELRATVLAIADELASAAELVMHKIDRVPVAVIRNYAWSETAGSARDLVMTDERNLFR